MLAGDFNLLQIILSCITIFGSMQIRARMRAQNLKQSLTLFTVRDARVEKLAFASKDILAECAVKCSAIQEAEVQEHQNLRYAKHPRNLVYEGIKLSCE